jgi:methyltransferase (TIGR00027 family)
MQSGQPSRTAFRVAMRRAAHQVIDNPRVLDDPIAMPLLGPDFSLDHAREAHPVARAFRAFMAARSRFAEDKLAQAVAEGAIQYVVLGAGLDTFAWRNRLEHLRIFEVDFPATQEWKKELLMRAGLARPANLTFVPMDFEHKTLAEGLADTGFDWKAKTFFGWLGVAPYLTLEAFQATIAAIAALPLGSGVAFDYAVSPEHLSPGRRKYFDALAARVAAAGEPFKTFFAPEQMEAELHTAGFTRVEQADSTRLNDLYFRGRADGMTLPEPGLGMMAAAWV